MLSLRSIDTLKYYLQSRIQILQTRASGSICLHTRIQSQFLTTLSNLAQINNEWSKGHPGSCLIMFLIPANAEFSGKYELMLTGPLKLEQGSFFPPFLFNGSPNRRWQHWVIGALRCSCTSLRHGSPWTSSSRSRTLELCCEYQLTASLGDERLLLTFSK